MRFLCLVLAMIILWLFPFFSAWRDVATRRTTKNEEYEGYDGKSGLANARAVFTLDDLYKLRSGQDGGQSKDTTAYEGWTQRNQTITAFLGGLSGFSTKIGQQKQTDMGMVQCEGFQGMGWLELSSLDRAFSFRLGICSSATPIQTLFHYLQFLLFLEQGFVGGSAHE